MGVDMSHNQADGTPTLTERDIDRSVGARDSRPNAMTSQDIADLRDWRRAQGRAAVPPPEAPPSVTAQLTTKHWAGLGTVLLTVLSVAGAGGYTGVSSMTAAEVSARDEANRKVVSEELEKVVEQMTARADKDRADAETKFKEVRGDIKGIRKDIHSIDKSVTLLTERTRDK